MLSNEVHVWSAFLSQSIEKLQDYWSCLSESEKERANKFLHQKSRDGFVVARGILRNLLARYLNCAPQDLEFSFGEYGKLYLKNSPLEFNLSHSRDAILYAFSLQDPVGIDVEFMRQGFDFESIVERFFSKLEIENLFALPKDLRLAGFFHTWARKEAFIKAIGKGVFYDLSKFSVAVDPLASGQLALSDKDWNLYALDCRPEYAAALVVASGHEKIIHYAY